EIDSSFPPNLQSSSSGPPDVVTICPSLSSIPSLLSCPSTLISAPSPKASHHEMSSYTAPSPLTVAGSDVYPPVRGTAMVCRSVSLGHQRSRAAISEKVIRKSLSAEYANGFTRFHSNGKVVPFFTGN